jgi:hypothetical protein
MGGLAGADNDAAGLMEMADAAVIGVEIALNENLLGGLTLDYSSLNSDSALVDVDDQAIQDSAYASWKHDGWFADGLFGYGSHDLDLTVRSDHTADRKHSADAISAALRGSYLFDIGGVKRGQCSASPYWTRVTATLKAATLPWLFWSIDKRTVHHFGPGVGPGARATGSTVLPALPGGMGRDDMNAHNGWRSPSARSAPRSRISKAATMAS